MPILHNISYDLAMSLSRDVRCLNVGYSYRFEIWLVARQMWFRNVHQALKRMVKFKYGPSMLSVLRGVATTMWVPGLHFFFSFQKEALWCLRPKIQQGLFQHEDAKKLHHFELHVSQHMPFFHLNYYLPICNNITLLYEAWVRLHNCGKCKSYAMFCIERDIVLI